MTSRPTWLNLVLGCLMLVGPMLGGSTVVHGEDFFLQFRDGSIVLADVKTASLEWTEFQVGRPSNGNTIDLQRIGNLTLAQMPVTERLNYVQSLLSQLSSEDYQERELATQELKEKGAEFLDIVEAYQESTDPEVRWRVKGILHHISNAMRNSPRLDFDSLILWREGGAGNSAQASVQGDSGDFSLKAVAFGQNIEVPRRKLSAIWRPGYEPRREGQAEVVGQRISSDEVDRFPPNSVRIGFSNAPDGSELTEGQTVDNSYTDWGVRFSTDIEDGSIAVFNFGVGGAPSRRPSAGGHAAGTSDEDYKGVTTIRFHAPGRPDVPATVTMFGCYMAIIKKDGTLMRFFDTQGQLITTLSTTRNTWEFVGFRSPRPIARVEIHPTNVDPNYAIDDVIFDQPRVISESIDGRLASISLRDGQQLKAERIEVSDEWLTLHDLTVGIEEAKIPAAEVAYLSPISQPFDPLQAEPHAWIQTVEGNRIAVRLAAEGAVARAHDGAVIPADQIRALWSSRQIDLEIGLATDQPRTQWLDSELQPHPVNMLAIVEGGVTGEGGSPAWTDVVPEKELPLIITGAPPSWDVDAPYVRLADGQFWLLNDERIVFRGWSDQALQLEFYGQPISVPLDEIAAVKLGGYGR